MFNPLISQIRKTKLNDEIVEIRKYNDALSTWIHVELNTKDENENPMIILICEDEIILGFMEETNESNYLHQVRGFWLPHLLDDQLKKIALQLNTKYFDFK